MNKHPCRNECTLEIIGGTYCEGCKRTERDKRVWNSLAPSEQVIAFDKLIYRANKELKELLADNSRPERVRTLQKMISEHEVKMDYLSDNLTRMTTKPNMVKSLGNFNVNAALMPANQSEGSYSGYFTSWSK